MDPIDELIHKAIQHEIQDNTNPYLTLETIVLRLYKKILDRTRVSYTQSDKTSCFVQWHPEILSAYEKIRSNMSHDERAYVERVLSKDGPHPTELVKFATCWYKYDPLTACKWFAVDGTLGNHPKAYVQEAFCPTLSRHCRAVRTLYAYNSDPEKIKEIVEKALLINDDEPCHSDLDPEFERCVGVYAEIAGEETMKWVASERESKANQQQSSKRTKTSNKKSS